MRGKGINYDTGSRPAGRPTRDSFDADLVGHEMRVIARDLHCTAVRITGGDPTRLSVAAERAAEVGLEVWFSPFPCEMTIEEMLPYFADCAERAERLRRQGADVVLVTGGELSLFARGFIAGDDLFARIGRLSAPAPQLREELGQVPARLNTFLAEVVTTTRAVFGGTVTYASLPYEQVDWALFDYAAVDAYRAVHNARTYREELRRYHRHGRPVVVTEFGCCTYRGAADRGARGWMIIDRLAQPPRLDGDYLRDEDEQATYLTDLLRVFDQEHVDTAFWYTFAGYNFPHHRDPRYDLDMASYGLIKLNSDGRWEPKAAFHALAAAYAD